MFLHNKFASGFSMGHRIREKHALQHDIGAALAKNELELYFPAILRLGRALAMPVIAEGVETKEQRLSRGKAVSFRAI
jgi:hypothetical protein